jgi:hypothetical protein
MMLSLLACQQFDSEQKLQIESELNRVETLVLGKYWGLVRHFASY